MKKVSVIIPVYNAEKFLDRCLLSVVNQTYKNLEIIVINDGSTDKSEEICLKFLSKDNRIKYYKIDNGGVSNARNYGLDVATGEYITFLDADDYIEENTYSDCIKIANTYNPDIIKFNFMLETENYYYNIDIHTECDTLITDKDYTEKVYNHIFSSGDYSNIWNAMIRRTIIKDLRFNKNIKYGEDFLFMVQVLLESKSLYYIKEKYYHYIDNIESATKSYKDEKIKEQIININIVLDTIYSYIKKSNFDKTTYKHRLIADLNGCYDKIKKYSNYQKYLEIYEYMNTNTAFKKTLSNFNKEEIINELPKDFKTKFYINKTNLLVKDYIRCVLIKMKIKINNKYVMR